MGLKGSQYFSIFPKDLMFNGSQNVLKLIVTWIFDVFYKVFNRS